MKITDWLVVGFVAWSGLGCAHLGFAPTGPVEEVVKARAEARWFRLLAKDVSSAYEFLTPASRRVYDLKSFSRSVNPGIFRAARVTSVDCESSEACSVGVEVSYAARMGVITTPIAEKWVRVEGGWFIVWQD